jgi:hypothetical protein
MGVKLVPRLKSTQIEDVREQGKGKDTSYPYA